MRGAVLPYMARVKTKILLLRKYIADFQKKGPKVPWVTLYQIPLSHVDWSNNMAAWWRDCFALYDYGAHFKILLLKYQPYFQIIW